MVTIVFYGMIACAIVTMLTALFKVVRLRRVARGGAIGGAVNILAGFVVLFLVGYLGAPLMPRVPLELSLVFVGAIFLFGAVFVVLVLKLIEDLVRKVLTDLKL